MRNPKRFTHLVLLVYSLVAAAASFAQPRASARLTDDTLLIGEQTRLIIEITSDKTENWRYIQEGDSLPELITVVDYQHYDTLQDASAGTFTLRQELTITCFDSGSHTIPPLPLVLINKGAHDTLYTPALPLTIFTVPVDTIQPFRDIAPPLNTPMTLAEFMVRFGYYIFAGLVVLALVLWLLMRLIRRARNRPLTAVTVRRPVEQPYDKALRLLEALRLKKLWQQGRYLEYHIELTEIVREYLEAQFGIPALERTTAEILDDCRNTKTFSEGELVDLQNALDLSDLVKFAKADPLPAEHENCMSLIRSFVLATRPYIESVENQPSKEKEESADE